MKRLAIVMSLAAGLMVYGQRIETQKADHTRITRVETALNHLTVIEVGDPVDQVAAGSASFKVEWRNNKVFVQPLEPEAATNLFIWTKSGSRLSYELVPAGSVEKMHFAIDQEPAVVAAAVAPQPATTAVEKPRIPSDMLYQSVPVRVAGVPGQKSGIEILLRDLYEKDGKVYLRCAIHNSGTVAYQPGAPVVVSLKSPRSAQSLYAMSKTQLGESFRITAQAEEEVHVVHSEIEAPLVAPGEQTVGLLALEVPRSPGPTVLRLMFPADRNYEVVATLVL